MMIELIKPRLQRTIRYRVEPVWQHGDAVCARAVWVRGPVDLQLFGLENGDILHEYFYARRWYNIFAVADSHGRRKGWYCNMARPAEISSDLVRTVDLELDLVIAADRTTSRVLDHDEYLAAGIAADDPAADVCVRRALDELRVDAAARRAAFDDETPAGVATCHC